jgi:phage gp36-like protein
VAYLTIGEFHTLGTSAKEADLRELDDPDQVNPHLDAVSDEADDYLRGRYIVPLSAPSVSRALKRHLANYAYANLMDIIGRSAEGDDSLIDKNRDACIAYLKMLRDGELTLDAPLAPAVVEPAEPPLVIDIIPGAGPAVYSEPSRGF